jgi:hypothetical protein
MVVGSAVTHGIVSQEMISEYEGQKEEKEGGEKGGGLRRTRFDALFVRRRGLMGRFAAS